MAKRTTATIRAARALVVAKTVEIDTVSTETHMQVMRRLGLDGGLVFAPRPGPAAPAAQPLTPFMPVTCSWAWGSAR